jgi:hypothetical protein
MNIDGTFNGQMYDSANPAKKYNYEEIRYAGNNGCKELELILDSESGFYTYELSFKTLNRSLYERALVHYRVKVLGANGQFSVQTAILNNGVEVVNNSFLDTSKNFRDVTFGTTFEANLTKPIQGLDKITVTPALLVHNCK